MCQDISVVIPARNAASSIQRTLHSILTSPEILQILVVDDGSTDDTAAQAKALNDPRVEVLQGPANGIAAALNCGFDAVQGQYVARCDADDTCPKGRFTWQRRWLEMHPNYIAVSAGYQSVDSRGNKIADLAMQGKERDVTSELLAGDPVTSLCTWLIRKEAIQASGGARIWFETAEDIDLQCRLAALGPIRHVPKLSYYYWLHDGSVTHRQATSLRLFFETQARAFARQRATIGKDDLECDRPPDFDLHASPNIQASPAAHQIARQLTGAAWHSFGKGDRIRAYQQMLNALRNRPLSTAVWRNMIALCFKSLTRK